MVGRDETHPLGSGDKESGDPRKDKVKQGRWYREDLRDDGWGSLSLPGTNSCAT